MDNMQSSAFYSNRQFNITCPMSKLPSVIEFAMKFFDHEDMFTREKCRVKPAYQISHGGSYYAIGAGSMAPDEERRLPGLPTNWPWKDLPFDYSPENIANAVFEWMRGNTSPELRANIKVHVNSMCSILMSDPHNHGIRGNDCPILIFSEVYDWPRNTQQR